MALVWISDSSSAASSTNADVSAPAFTSTTGNAIIVAAGVYNNANEPTSITDTAGNTYTLAITKYDTAATQMRISIYYSLNITGNASNIVTINRSGSGRWFIITNEWSGVATASAVDLTGSATATSGNIDAGNTGTLAQAEEMIFVANAANPGNPGVGTGYTNYKQSTNAISSSVQSKVVAATTSTATAFATADNNYVVAFATFKGAASASPAHHLTTLGVG